MSEFDSTQNELDKFLDSAFSTDDKSEDVKDKKDTGVDPELEEYLRGEDDGEQQSDTADYNEQKLDGERQKQPQREEQEVKQDSDKERLLMLERELAATKARAEMYESAIRAGYEARVPSEQNKDAQRLPERVFTDEELEIEERLKTDYGDADPYIQAIARRVANEMYQKAVAPLHSQLEEVKGQLTKQKDVNIQNQKFSLETQLRQAVPDLDEIAYSSEWAGYISQPAPFSGGTETIANIVQRGIQSGNMKQVVEIINDFKSKRSQGQPQQQQVSPGRSQTTQPATKQPGKRTLKMSDFDRATAAFEAGRMSWDKYQVIVDEFNTAMAEGRVNTNR